MDQILAKEETDVISENTLVEVDEKMLEFEMNLFHPDMGMLIAISKNQKEKITDPTTFIGKKGQEVASKYASVLCLHSMSRRPDLTFPDLKNTLNTFSDKLTSELPKLLEIIEYIFEGSSKIISKFI